ncbi:hypothetical protein COOONC_06332 [Cooperia oncophora]
MMFNTYSFKKACDLGLHAIVADGMHSLHPKSLGYQAQVYCVHGVCSEGVEIPLLYCITEKKTEKVYLKIFAHLKATITSDAPRRVVLDFEKSAIKAARKTFPAAAVEGCAFHIAQAWNRRRTHIGLTRYTQGVECDARVAEWWDTVKGKLIKFSALKGSYSIVFLPTPLLPHVRALRGPPVPSGHGAFEKCKKFLEYLNTTWMQGPFKNMWCKWKVEELRTTNLAEAFHRL